MPENYTAMLNTPQANEARQIVVKVEPYIDCVTSAIAKNQVTAEFAKQAPISTV